MRSEKKMDHLIPQTKHNLNDGRRMTGRSTTREAKFAECRMLCQVQKIGHSANPLFAECCTRQRCTLGEQWLCRVPQSSWHSAKSGTLQRPSLPSATLGKEWHSAKKSVTSRPLGKEACFAECQGLALGKCPLYRVAVPALGKVFFCFFYLFFCELFPHYLKLHVQIWGNFKFFLIYLVHFFVSLNFFGIF
jgi:hypothetical protein